ncbi:MAG TPA: adenylate kinase family protein [Candidatus Azoamicus sp. MARI]
MKIIIFGAPGSGKGTQASLLANKKLFLRLSPGDLLRYELSKNSELSLKIRSCIEKGYLINDELVFNLINKYLSIDNILFDGYPRNLNQALFLNSKNIKIDLIININVSILSIFKRMKYRMISSDVDIVLDLLNKFVNFIRYKHKDTGSNFFKRIDDRYSVINRRLTEYSIENYKMLDYYSKSGVFILNVDGNHDINSVYNFIENYINEFYEKNK